MSRRQEIKKVIIIGSGPIIIGQAAEFDYAGTQACRALREEGVEVILINSNPATIMTDREIADKVYIEPLTAETVKKVILKENPDSILPTLGGQNALNLAVELEESGFLREHHVEMIGTSADTIRMAEDRELFKEAMDRDRPALRGERGGRVAGGLPEDCGPDWLPGSHSSGLHARAAAAAALPMTRRNWPLLPPWACTAAACIRF